MSKVSTLFACNSPFLFFSLTHSLLTYQCHFVPCRVTRAYLMRITKWHCGKRLREMGEWERAEEEGDFKLTVGPLSVFHLKFQPPLGKLHSQCQGKVLGAVLLVGIADFNAFHGSSSRRRAAGGELAKCGPGHLPETYGGTLKPKSSLSSHTHTHKHRNRQWHMHNAKATAANT